MRYRVFRIVSKLMSYVISAVLTLLIIVCVESGVSMFTIGSEDFMLKYFTNGRTVSMLNANLEQGYDELSEKSGIPTEVYMSATGESLIRSVQRTVLRSTQSTIVADFGGTTDIEKRLSSAIEVYDDENKIKRSEAARDKLVDDAINVFNSTCSIKNNSQLSRISSLINNRLLYAVVAAIVGIAVCVILENFFNWGRRKSFNYVAMAMVTAGGIMISFALIIILTGALPKLALTNIEAYNSAIASAAKFMMMLSFAGGVVVTAGGLMLFLGVFRYYRKKLMDIDTEDEIAKNLIRHNND